MKNTLLVVFLIITLTACAHAQPTMIGAQNTATAQTNLALTQTSLPTATPHPSTFTPTATIVYPTASSLPSTPPTVVSPYEADHEAIRKVIASYFDKIYSMHNSFQIDGFGNTVSMSDEAKGFLKTELRK